MKEVLLWQDIPKLGKRGDMVKVADGYARNYLLPRKLVSKATKENLKQLENHKKRIVREEEKIKLNLKDIATEIEKASCILEVKANEEGVLFGSVTVQMIADALNHQGWKQVQPAMIELEAPIKELGVYRVTVKLLPDITANCRVWVVEQGSETGKDKI